MAATPKYKFSKRHRSSISKPKQADVWSGRGIGIPVMGAVDGSGDGSKYLGRPPRPWYVDDMGSPSQSADSGFSSRMGTVNKGYGHFDEYYFSMFPDQEGDIDDKNAEEERLSIDQKLPTYTGAGGVVLAPVAETHRKVKTMSNLREFIREVAKEEIVKREIEQPVGYKVFKSEYLGTEADEEDEIEAADETGYVNYKADLGMVSYEPRGALQEELLRSVIRSKILTFLESPDQKKRS